MSENKVCPQCGKTIEFDETREFMFCNYCGTKIMRSGEQAPQNTQPAAPAPPVMNNAGNPNLHIQYASINPTVGMVVHFVATNQMNYYFGGQQYSYTLPAGMHQLVLKIGKISYNRTIFIRDDNAPVTIYASWDGRAHIIIDQPPYIPVVPMQPGAPVAYYAAPGQMPMQAPYPGQTPMQAAYPGQTPMQAAYPAQTPPAKTCPTCGKGLEADAEFCTKCGTKL